MSTASSQAQTELFPIPYSYSEKLLIQSGIRYLIGNQFSIPKPLVDKYFHTYYLLYWSGKHLISKLSNREGFIEKDGILWKVIFHKGLTRGKIAANLDSQYALSFRQADEWLRQHPTVLISKSGD